MGLMYVASEAHGYWDYLIVAQVRPKYDRAPTHAAFVVPAYPTILLPPPPLHPFYGIPDPRSSIALTKSRPNHPLPG